MPRCRRRADFRTYRREIGPSAALLALLLLPATAGAQAPTSCEEGPRVVGNVIYGTPCDDTIVVRGDMERVQAGPGDDLIVAGPIPLANASLFEGEYLGIGSQIFNGGPGDDIVFGGRGNDQLNGGLGDDLLFGGPGDDTLRGGPGDDRLSGGFGFDWLDGEAGSDHIRGDATVDALLADSGDDGQPDTISFATGVTPGFPDNQGPADLADYEANGFPPGPQGRGVYLDLSTGFASNGVAPDGGGVDSEIGVGDFETAIGTAFADFIVGTGAAETIYGGGGSDVLRGAGGADAIYGGAEGDSCVGESVVDCEGAGLTVSPRPGGSVAAGMTQAGDGPAGVYLVGAEAAADSVAISQTSSGVVFSLAEGAFDEATTNAGGCSVATPTEALCPAPRPDSLVVAGLGGDDRLEAADLPNLTSLYLLGGEGDDRLRSEGPGEDVIVDGPGDDEALGGDSDDVLLNNEGVDTIRGEGGNDLLLSDSRCDGDTIDGGGGRDNASWSKLKQSIAARLGPGWGAGAPDAGGEPVCAGALDALPGIEDLEGTDGPDFFYGGPGDSQLLGRKGADTYGGEAGADRVLANDGDFDGAIDCGGDAGDIALVDLAPPSGPGDPPPTGCATVVERPVNQFFLPPPPPGPGPEPDPEPEPEGSSPQPPPRALLDRTPPNTRIAHRPAPRVLATARTRRVAFRFASNEPGARFRCRLDRGPFLPCRSPRRYRLALGPHAFAVFAIDPAGNRDRTPAKARFRVSAR